MRREIAQRKDPSKEQNKENITRYKDFREKEPQNQSKERFSKERTRPSQKPIMEDNRTEKHRSFYMTEK
jgi:hypothetical protein